MQNVGMSRMAFPIGQRPGGQRVPQRVKQFGAVAGLAVRSHNASNAPLLIPPQPFFCAETA